MSRNCTHFGCMNSYECKQEAFMELPLSLRKDTACHHIKPVVSKPRVRYRLRTIKVTFWARKIRGMYVKSGTYWA